MEYIDVVDGVIKETAKIEAVANLLDQRDPKYGGNTELVGVIDILSDSADLIKKLVNDYNDQRKKGA
jgi:hypothetical protein